MSTIRPCPAKERVKPPRPPSTTEIADRMGISRKWVRHIEQGALDKIRGIYRSIHNGSMTIAEERAVKLLAETVAEVAQGRDFRRVIVRKIAALQVRCWDEAGGRRMP